MPALGALCAVVRVKGKDEACAGTIAEQLARLTGLCAQAQGLEMQAMRLSKHASRGLEVASI